MKLTALLVTVLLAGAGTARADDVRPRPTRPDRRALRLQRLDTNHDGQIEPAERQAARLARRAARIRRFDANHDGQLDPQERRTARAARLDRLKQRLLARFDANGDGNLTPGELPPRLERKLRRLDHNRDGWIDDADK